MLAIGWTLAALWLVVALAVTQASARAIWRRNFPALNGWRGLVIVVAITLGFQAPAVAVGALAAAVFHRPVLLAAWFTSLFTSTYQISRGLDFLLAEDRRIDRG